MKCGTHTRTQVRKTKSPETQTQKSQFSGTKTNILGQNWPSRLELINSRHQILSNQ